MKEQIMFGLFTALMSFTFNCIPQPFETLDKRFNGVAKISRPLPW